MLKWTNQTIVEKCVASHEVTWEPIKINVQENVHKLAKPRNESPRLTLWCKNCRRWKTFRIKPTNRILVCFLCLHMTSWESLRKCKLENRRHNKRRRFSKRNKNIEKTKSSERHITNLRFPLDTRSDKLLSWRLKLICTPVTSIATTATRF